MLKRRRFLSSGLASAAALAVTPARAATPIRFVTDWKAQPSMAASIRRLQRGSTPGAAWM